MIGLRLRAAIGRPFFVQRQQSENILFMSLGFGE